MKFVKLTFQYIKGKHFWKLAALTLLPSLLFSFLSSFSNIASFFVNFFDQNLSSFAAIYSKLIDVNGKNFVFVILSIVVFSSIIAILIGAMQRHMRTGKFSAKNTFRRINDNFMPTILVLVILYIIIYMFGFLISLLIAFWFAVTKIQLATLILSAFFTLVIFIVLAYLISLFCLSTPFMVTTGAGIFSSASSSIRTTRNHIKDIFVAITLPLIPLFALEYVAVIINIWIVSILIDTFFVSFLMCYYPVLIFVTYYDIQQMDREDLLPVNRL
ncbi:MAG: hypothetical protein EOM87_04055 [Clostridia bacterium]|nr:hypothetical protein [Clostridia bacterium]